MYLDMHIFYKAVCHNVIAARSSQEQPEAPRSSQGQPGAASSKRQPGAARTSQNQPGAARKPGMRSTPKNVYKVAHRYADHTKKCIQDAPQV